MLPEVNQILGHNSRENTAALYRMLHPVDVTDASGSSGQPNTLDAGINDASRHAN
jgi:hypothetical protein